MCHGSNGRGEERATPPITLDGTSSSLLQGNGGQSVEAGLDPEFGGLAEVVGVASV